MKETLTTGMPAHTLQRESRPNRQTAARLAALLVLTMALLGGFLWWQHGRFHTTAVYPAPNASGVATNARLILHFNETLPTALPADAINLSPPVSGQFTSQGHTLIFTPDAPLQSKTTYTVRLSGDLQAENGRRLPWSQSWRFDTGGPRIAFLQDSDSDARRLIILAIDGGSTTALTPANGRVTSYALSPDGSRLAYTLETDTGTAVWLTTTDGQKTELLLACAPDQCRQPVWHPDGRRLLYERLGAGGQTPTLWWLDSHSGDTIPALDTYPAVSHSARFSPNGAWLSFVAHPEEGIWLYNFDTGARHNVASLSGTPGIWAPDGRSLLFRDQFLDVLHGSESDDHLEHSHGYAQSVVLFRRFADGRIVRLSQGYELDDGGAVWSPVGDWIAFTRAKARVFMGRQIWLMRADGSDVRALTSDFDFQHGPPQWSADGRYLLFQRTDLSVPTPQPGIWLYDLENESLIELYDDGLLPTWIP